VPEGRVQPVAYWAVGRSASVVPSQVFAGRRACVSSLQVVALQRPWTFSRRQRNHNTASLICQVPRHILLGI